MPESLPPNNIPEDKIEKEHAALKPENFSSVASALGVMLLVENVKKGKTISIPSLGITLTYDDLKDEYK